MMITPEMMEQLGGKRGKARGPDMTNREISEGGGEDIDDGFKGAGTLDDALGDWSDGRGAAFFGKKKTRKPRRDKAYDEFVAANDRLEAMLGGLRVYVAGLRQFCDATGALTTGLVVGLGAFDGVADTVARYQATSQSWCRTSKVPHVDSALHSQVEVAFEMSAIDPLVAHVEVRRNLQAQLAAATGVEREALMEEVELFAQSMAGVMKGPMRALKRGQLDLLGAAADALRDDPQPAPLAGEPDTAVVEAQQPEAPMAALDLWAAVAAADPWPAAVLATPPPSSSCLSVRGQFGWLDGRRVLRVSLRNGASVPVTDISIALLQSTRAGIPVATVPLALASLAARDEATTIVALRVAEDAGAVAPPPHSAQPLAEAGDDEFDSFFTERSSAAFTPRPDVPAPVERQDSQPVRTAASWALDAAACAASTLSFSVRCREQPAIRTAEVPLPYQLLLHGRYRMPYTEFERLWNAPSPAADSSVTVPAGGGPATRGGFASSLARRRAYSGTTRMCVRVEGVAPLVGFARFEEDTLLSDARASLRRNPAFEGKLPGDWVFVKKKAPVGKKAEGKWRVGDLGHEIVLRGKGEQPLPASFMSGLAEGAGSVDGDEEALGLRLRSFVMSTSLTVAEVVQALSRGGVALAGRVEQQEQCVGIEKTEGLLRFGARAGESDPSGGDHVLFLLQMEQMERQTLMLEPEPEPEPEPELEPDAVAPQEWDWVCTLRATDSNLEPVFEACVRSLVSGVPSLSEQVEIVGGGRAYFGEWGGDTLASAQEGIGNDNGFVYGEYGGISQSQVSTQAILTTARFPSQGCFHPGMFSDRSLVTTDLD